jgi:argininosuccinate lyase
MWGGRYKLGPSEIMEKINASIGFDKRLYAQDIAGSLAHAEMLVARGILTAKDGAAIRRGLKQVQAEIESGRFKFSTKLEDIHFNVEARLTDLIGPAGGRLHTARSRNDQIALDVRLWVRDTIDKVEAMLQDLQAALIDRADQYAATIMPGFTCWRMSRCSAAIAAASPTAGRASTNRRWAPRPSPARRIRSTVTARPGRWASTGRWPIRSMPCPTATT